MSISWTDLFLHPNGKAQGFEIKSIEDSGLKIDEGFLFRGFHLQSVGLITDKKRGKRLVSSGFPDRST